MGLHDRIMEMNNYNGDLQAAHDGFEHARRMSAEIAKEGDAQIEQARQIITDLLEYAEKNDPGCPHIGRAKGFLSGGEGL